MLDLEFVLLNHSPHKLYHFFLILFLNLKVKSFDSCYTVYTLRTPPGVIVCTLILPEVVLFVIKNENNFIFFRIGKILNLTKKQAFIFYDELPAFLFIWVLSQPLFIKMNN